MRSIISKKWINEEDEILIENYSKIGPSGCSKLLKRTVRACQIRAKKLKLKYSIIKDYYEKENLLNIINKSFSIRECLISMNLSVRPGNYKTIKKYINLYELNTDHFYSDKRGGLNKYTNSLKYDINDILIENSNYSTSKLKKRLYDEGYKDRYCEMCGQDEVWKGKKMSLILDHINGINNDNRLENLRIVCPNCNATLDTHCRGNKRINTKEINKCKCGKEINKSSKKCLECSSLSQRKVERPSLETLLKEIEELGYVGTGKKYGVSDNSIRKWVKTYLLNKI
jgi:hypothetical protein